MIYQRLVETRACRAYFLNPHATKTITFTTWSWVDQLRFNYYSLLATIHITLGLRVGGKVQGSLTISSRPEVSRRQIPGR